MKHLSTTILLTLFSLAMFGQANDVVPRKRAAVPTVMIFPSHDWCRARGYISVKNEQGKTKENDDYEKAIGDAEFNQVASFLVELFNEKGLPTEDLGQAIRNVNMSEATNEVLTSSNGTAVMRSPMSILLDYAKADINIVVGWTDKVVGPKHILSFNLRAIDSYTGDNVSSVAVQELESLSAGVDALLADAANAKIDAFVNDMVSYFEKLSVAGRSIHLEIKVFDGALGINLESEYNGEELRDIITDWLDENAVNGDYNERNSDEAMMDLKVRIPLYRENGSKMDARQFARLLTRKLKSAPTNIDSKVTSYGLGWVLVTLGEK